MLVLFDMEWIENEYRMYNPTQLAAIRVNSKWEVVDQYSSLIKPYEATCYDERHVAYSGATQGAFLTAKSAIRVFGELEKWFCEDDKVCCWNYYTVSRYLQMIKIILKRKTNANFYAVGNRAKELMEDGYPTEGNPYTLARKRNIPVPEPMHYSENDVETMRLLLSAVIKKQSDLLVPTQPKHKKGATIRQTAGNENAYKPGVLPYWRDIRKNTIHADGCSHLFSAKEIRGYGSFTAALKLQAKACSCVAKEYRKAAIERNIGILNRCQYNYVYGSNSSVFHRYDCRMIQTLYTGTIMGSTYYDVCEQSGRTPCRVCNPTPYVMKDPPQINDKPIPKKQGKQPTPPKKKKKYIYSGVNRSLDMAEQKAYKRYCEAKTERISLEDASDLSKEERQDLLTLTHPGYAFWAGRGYNTFHLRNCPKLNGVKELKGFALYQEATRAGLTPCKQCKPKKHHEISVSIPLSNHTRIGETVEMLDAMCDAAGYTHQYENNFYIITTPVGKWKLDVYARPVKVEHVNFVKSGERAGYHQQPRIFLSLTDTFNYILRHDKSLTKEQL